MSNALLVERETGSGTSEDPRAREEFKGETYATVVPSNPTSVLMEVPGDVGLVLWLALRDVVAWGVAPEAERGGVFPAGAAANRRARLERVCADEHVMTPLTVLAELAGNPSGTPPLLVTRACLSLARYLAGTGADLSALAFARAAALASPAHPRPSLEVGRLLAAAREGESLEWLVRALELSLGPEHQEVRAEVHAELGTLYYRRRQRRKAQAHLLAALRAARRSEPSPSLPPAGVGADAGVE